MTPGSLLKTKGKRPRISSEPINQNFSKFMNEVVNKYFIIISYAPGHDCPKWLGLGKVPIKRLIFFFDYYSTTELLQPKKKNEVEFEM